MQTNLSTVGNEVDACWDACEELTAAVGSTEAIVCEVDERGMVQLIGWGTPEKLAAEFDVFSDAAMEAGSNAELCLDAVGFALRRGEENRARYNAAQAARY